MNLPKVLQELLEAQSRFDSKKYASLFSEFAVVQDEGVRYKGIKEIEEWNQLTNKKYQTNYFPLYYDEISKILTVEVSGTFQGSPVIMRQQYVFDQEGKIIEWKNV
ncbi:nuclear transport factor 2 family protein [Lactococcus lactis subsp. lactis]|uniref:hypothetical protein n=1 Tax=Lactococcus lactis TaxID=1358 RepID=UPI00223ACC6B|nr:hypothetical protein [Lactococcus lactis]MCT0017334.1 nuclear transport factor 2 family protein [Lactococcus lactis subsp. lactis]